MAIAGAGFTAYAFWPPVSLLTAIFAVPLTAGGVVMAARRKQRLGWAVFGIGIPVAFLLLLGVGAAVLVFSANFTS